MQFPERDIRYEISEKKILGYILPALRVGYIAQRKELVLDKEERDTHLLEIRSRKMREVLEEFDSILQKDQELSQKDNLMSRLLWFFGIETALLFAILFLKGYGIITLDDTTLNIITGATILQVVTMLVLIIKNLYPQSTKEKNIKTSSSDMHGSIISASSSVPQDNVATSIPTI